MKKTFKLVDPKHKYARMIEMTKHEIRKYLKRNRRKSLPEGYDYWDFDCKYGDTEAEAKCIHLSEIDACIKGAEERELSSFYIEILGRPAKRQSKNL